MEEKYYIKEIVKLLAIMNQDPKDIMVSRKYIIEKLERILNGVGIGLHPSLEEWVRSYLEKSNLTSK